MKMLTMDFKIISALSLIILLTFPAGRSLSYKASSVSHEHHDLESIELYACKVKFLEFKNPSGIKKFSLGWTNLSNCQFNELLVKCTSFQEFSLKKCWNVRILTISAPKMKNLALNKCSDFNGDIDIEEQILKTFKYSGEMICFNMEYLSTMEMAEVDFANEEEISENAEYLYNLLNELWRTKVLTVCSYLLKELPSAPEYPSLECLRKLILKTSLDKNKYDGISYILKSCPNLESLTFNLSLQRIFQDEATHLGIQDHPFLNGSKYKENGFLFKCLRTLKKVKILGFKGDFNETKVIKYLIDYFWYCIEESSYHSIRGEGPRRYEHEPKRYEKGPSVHRKDSKTDFGLEKV